MIDDFKPPSKRALPKLTPYTPATPPKDPDPRVTLPESVDTTPDNIDAAPAKRPRRSLKAWFRGLSKKQKIIMGVSAAAALLLTGGGVFALTVLKKEPPKPAPVVQKKEEKPPEPPKPTTEASRLTGVQISPELNKRPVTGIMIENSPDARPQSGLRDAGVVFEAVAEGGITRFLALFMEAQPDYIGPIRSARPYYIEWLLPFDGAYAHVGGSPDALALIKSQGAKDIDQFANGGYYQRITSRYAPHNVYTSMAKLDELKTKKGFTTSTFTGFARKNETVVDAARVTTRSIDLNISSFLYNAHYDYDQASNTYKRTMAGKPHTDEKSGAQLAPKVVVALVMPKGLAADRLHTTYQSTGSGPMFVYQDGMQLQGTWSKPSAKAQFTFKDTNGQPLTLNPGQTWVSVVGSAADIVAKP